MELRNKYNAKMVCSRMVYQKSDEISSPSELVQVRVLRKAPDVKVGGPVRREELNSNRKFYPKISFEHLILFKQNRSRPTVESPKSSTGTLTKHCVQKND